MITMNAKRMIEKVISGQDPRSLLREERYNWVKLSDGWFGLGVVDSVAKDIIRDLGLHVHRFGQDVWYNDDATISLRRSLKQRGMWILSVKDPKSKALVTRYLSRRGLSDCVHEAGS